VVEPSPFLRLIAASDDYLLEEKVVEATQAASRALGGAEPEEITENASPHDLAVELCSPSLFNPQRILLVRDARTWVDAPAPAGAPTKKSRVDVSPLVTTIEGGLNPEIALIVGVWCGRRPKGTLVEAIDQAGSVEWLPLPAPPKPWEDVVLSDAQCEVLRGVIRRVAPQARLTSQAERLLLERLGFAPRQLATEVQKLATAVEEGEAIDDVLVRKLTFPRERSLEVVRDAVLRRQPGPLADLVEAGAAHVPVRDWRGQRLDPAGLAIILVGQVTSLLQQLLYVRRAAEATGTAPELDARRTRDRGWYGRTFKNRLAPKLMSHLETHRPSPLVRSGKPPSVWTLGQLFTGASRYSDQELVDALVGAGATEAAVRGPMALAAVAGWLTRTLGRD